MENIIKEIDRRIEEARGDVVKTTIELVNIKSVREEPLPGAPFGAGPRRVLDKMLELGAAGGFHCAEYCDRVVSLSMKPGMPDVGIWCHGDVVPEGDGWSFDPYNAVEYNGCVIGRGAGDNKGQISAIYHLLRIFKDMGIELDYTPALYVGSNEESGMEDLVGGGKGFCDLYAPPALSLVPDGGFPVGYGGKGAFNIFLKSDTPLVGCRIFGGLAASPFSCTAELRAPVKGEIKEGVSVDGCRVTARCNPYHGAHPPKDGNMITRLVSALNEMGCVSGENKNIFDFLALAGGDPKKLFPEICIPHPPMSDTTINAFQVVTEDGFVTLSLNIRYPFGYSFDEIVEVVTRVAKSYGFSVANTVERNKAYLLDPECEMVKMLCRVSDSVTGEEGKPFVLGGGTYAHKLPNAYVFGTSANRPPLDFKAGQGGVHGYDEAVSVDRLLRAMRIYARALLELRGKFSE